MILNIRISYIIDNFMKQDQEISTPDSSKENRNHQHSQQTQLQNQPQISITQIKPINEINSQNRYESSFMTKFVSLVCLLFLLVVNLYVYSILIQNMIERNSNIVELDKTLSEFNITKSHIQQRKQINRINTSIDSHNKTSMEKVTRINTKIPSLKQRISLGSPNTQQVKLIAWTISKIKTECMNSCGIINGQLLMNQYSVRSIQNLLDSAIDKAVIFTKITNIQQLTQLTSKFNKKYSITVPNTYQNIDSSYNFINHHLSYQKNGCHCDKAIYFSSSLIIRNSTSRRIAQVCAKLADSQLAVLNTFVPLRNKYESDEYINNEQSSDLYLNNNIASLPWINSMSLQDISPQLYSKYVYIFDSQYLKHISPLNFVYYVKYSLEQIFILPILAIVQKTNQLKEIQNITYGMPNNFRSAHQPIYKLYEPKSMKSNKNSKALCFVSYTSTPTLVHFQQISTYLDSLKNLDRTNLQLFVIIYIPYKFSNLAQSNNISFVYEKIKKMNLSNVHIKLRIRANKTLSAHAVYQSTYSYCPYQSLMISSRHNVRFVPSFGQELSANMNEKFHYYHANYLQLQKKQDNILTNVPKYVNRYQVRKSNLFRQHFRHVQIYTNKLMRTTTFWVLKNGQLDFYQTQAVFFILMMETIRLQLHYINKTLYHVTNRVYSNTQQQQIEILKKYVQYSAVGNKLITYTFNCLENRAYSRFAPDLLPKIIHQIWFGKDKISEVRMHLHRTIKQINPSFQIYLWRTSNITRENFPLTYSAVHKTLQYHKSYPKSLMALASDLLRYEAVYLFGGVYVDFKMEALRPIDPFLKYQSFFLDAGNGPQRFGDGQAVGVGVFGATQNNYHLKLLLNEILEMDNINFASKRISQLTGGFVVRKAYKTQQFFTVMGLGYHLFYPRPYDNPVNECGGVDKKFSIDQTVYTINDFLAKAKIKIGIPCKEYPQSYFVNFTPLARTWIGAKRNVG